MKHLIVPLSSITVRPQIRRHFRESEIQALSSSIKSDGLLQPLLCVMEDDVLLLIDGERRLRAVDLLNWDEVPVMLIEDALDHAEILSRQISTALMREDLTPIEKAEGIKAYIDATGMTADQASDALSLSPASVARSLALLALPTEIRDMVDAREIAADAAYQLSRVKDPAMQATLAKEVAAKRLNRDDLARQVRSASKSTRGGKRSHKTKRVTVALTSDTSVAVSAPSLSLDAVIDVLDQVIGRAKKARSQKLTLATFVRASKDQASSKAVTS